MTVEEAAKAFAKLDPRIQATVCPDISSFSTFMKGATAPFRERDCTDSGALIVATVEAKELEPIKPLVG